MVGKRWLFAGTVLLAALMVLTACGGRAQENSPGEVTERIPPTFPPTFTPKPTVTSQPTATPHPTEEPTLTVTLTVTGPPVATATWVPSVPSATPTWTPDANVTARPTSTPGTPVSDNATRQPQSGCIRSPAGQNLLINPDFEEGGHIQVYETVVVPDGWMAFWKEGVAVDYDPNNNDGYIRPEFMLIPNAPPYINPDRVLSGGRAFYIFGGSKVFDAGLMQKIAVSPGDTVCLTGFAHAWSSQGDDPFNSTLDTDDDQRNANFLLGIDPEGGSLPWVDGVVWGEVGHLYDSYQPIPGVQARAKSDTITIFVRGYSLWRFAHNDFFFDDIALQRVGS